VSEKSGVMKENCWTVVVHRVFYSHFIISLKKYDMVAKTFLYIIIILCFVNKLNSSMSNFGESLSQPKEIKLFLGISFFCQHNSTGGGFLILKQIIHCFFFFTITTNNTIAKSTWIFVSCVKKSSFFYNQLSKCC
jgi:hypothetical protein